VLEPKGGSLINRRVSAVDVRDIAEATAIALTTDGHQGKTSTSMARRC
jgi:uncharacterized protein YbjT (DUF2867 family)